MRNFLHTLSILFLLLLSGCDDSDKLAPVQWVLGNKEAQSDCDFDDGTSELVRFEDQKTKLWGYKDSSGHVRIDARFRLARPFSKYGLAQVWSDGRIWSRINVFGEIVNEAYFFDNGADYYVAGLTRIVENEKIGFADMHGQIVITPRFDWASPFAYDAPIAIVCEGCKSVPVNETGEYHEIVGGQWGAIDRSGKVVVPLEHDRLSSSESGAMFCKQKKCQQLFVDKKGTYHLQKFQK